MTKTITVKLLKELIKEAILINELEDFSSEKVGKKPLDELLKIYNNVLKGFDVNITQRGTIVVYDIGDDQKQEINDAISTNYDNIVSQARKSGFTKQIESQGRSTALQNQEGLMMIINKIPGWSIENGSLNGVLCICRR